MNEIICPSCGSLNIEYEKDTIVLSEPYGGENSIMLDNYICKDCDFEGDILDLNDPIIIRETNKLKSISCRNIIEFFEKIGISSRALERILGLQIRTLDKYKEANANPDPAEVTLLKLIRRFPWLLKVADDKFDLQKAHEIFMHEARKESKSIFFQ